MLEVVVGVVFILPSPLLLDFMAQCRGWSFFEWYSLMVKQKVTCTLLLLCYQVKYFFALLPVPGTR
jgi:hypothetical protein